MSRDRFKGIRPFCPRLQNTQPAPRACQHSHGFVCPSPIQKDLLFDFVLYNLYSLVINIIVFALACQLCKFCRCSDFSLHHNPHPLFGCNRIPPQWIIPSAHTHMYSRMHVHIYMRSYQLTKDPDRCINAYRYRHL